ncbi:MAG: class I SAM-dependent methyltransferase [Clostridiales bacterium]|nr:class I SAM-dependent methyltransferase [Clostridiales bacterium]
MSKRLEAIIDMVPDDYAGQKGQTIADVGTDHGFVPISLVRIGKASRAIAMDIGEGPLTRAREHIGQAGLTDRIEVRLSDGLERLSPGEADGVVITGMGGELMLRILKKDSHIRDLVRWWVLSPQSELGAFRHGLEELGLRICRETMLREDGKYYTVMLVRPGAMQYDREADYRYGKLLIQQRSPVLEEYLVKREKQIAGILEHLGEDMGESAVLRKKELEKEQKEIRSVYDSMQECNQYSEPAGSARSGV